MFFKAALTDICPLEFSADRGTMIKTASGILRLDPTSEKAIILAEQVKKHPNALFFRAKAIKANEPNSNGDYFSEEELLKSYKSFEGVPFFTNHDNQNIENARGKIVHAEWIPEEKSVYTLAFVDRDAYPHICRSIEEEYVNGVSMGALSEGTQILMGDGKQKSIEDVVAGDKVISHLGNVQEVTKTHCEYLGKPMYEISAKTYHKSPLFTEDHPILSISCFDIVEQKNEALKMAQSNRYARIHGQSSEFIGQDAWRRSEYKTTFVHASELNPNDYILVPSKFSLKNGSSDQTELYYVYGAFLGDGYLKKDKNGKYEAISFCIGIDEIELISKITSILKKFSSKEICSVVCQERNGIYLSLYDRELAADFATKFGTGSKNKRINFQIEYVDDAKQLLAGYIDTDGCIVDKSNQNVRGNKFGGVQISSVNIGLLEDVQSLLISLGHVSRISTFDRIPSENSVVNINTIENTLSIGSNAVKCFGDSIKFSNSGFGAAEILAGQSFITEISGNKYMACPVKEIRKIDKFERPVYDLTVANDESYIADGIAVHNCSVEYSVCNICKNKAERTDDYCSHIRNRKGRKFSGTAKDVNTGEVRNFKNELVFEYNYGLKFIELSAVVDPACPSCRIEGIVQNEDYLKRVASIQNELYMVKTSALEKHASQAEIDQIEQVLETLEGISVTLIQNRKQVEMEFASDLVQILSNLQTWLEELVGAGYASVGNDGGTGVPGTVGDDQSMPANGAPAPAAPAPAAPTPVASETPMDGSVGTVTGSPMKPAVSGPQLPISAPVMPRATSSHLIRRISDYQILEDNSKRFEDGNKLLKVAHDFSKKLNKSGENDMARRTVAEKSKQKEKAMEILSNSWQEKQDFFEYIKKVPSLQDSEVRLSVKKSDDSFIIVAESKTTDETITWTYEDLTEDQRKQIKQTPKEAAITLLEAFASNLNKQKEGVNRMTDIKKQAGANSVSGTPDVVQEKQLEQSGLYHSRTNADTHSITQKQLEEKRSGEKDVLTEKQLDDADLKLNPRVNSEVDVVTEAQMSGDNRLGDDKHSITQKQLESNRFGEKDVVTEKQLRDVPAPWARQAGIDPSMFKSASDHMEAVRTVIADTVIALGCTPTEACSVASSLVDSTKNRVDLAASIMEQAETEEINAAQRLAFWNNRNLKVASSGKKEIAESIVNRLRSVASDATINLDVLIDAVDVISESEIGAKSVETKVDEVLKASAQKTVAHVSRKNELRAALAPSVTVEDEKSSKADREAERKAILASVLSNQKKVASNDNDKIINKEVLATSNVVIDTTFSEIGTKKESSSFRKDVVAFTKGALASQQMKLAAITNVTIAGDTIQIAVQTDEGSQSVNIPIGENPSPAPAEEVPEGDMSGEGLDTSLNTGMKPLASSGRKMKRSAQFGGGTGGGVPGTPGGVAAPGAPEANIPGAAPANDPVQALTVGDEEGMGDETGEIPTIGEQQMPWTICPECGSADVDVSNEEGNIKGKCNSCTCKYEALVKKEVEFIIKKPTKSVGEEGGADAPEGVEDGAISEPEVPALPVAAQTRIDKNTIVRIGNNRKQHGHVCPACGNKNNPTSVDQDGHTEFTCKACKTDVRKDILIASDNPENTVLRIAWDLVPRTDCEGCDKEIAKFASQVRIGKILKEAAASGDKFPMGNCIERLAREYGGETVGTFGPCKGKLMADCVCGKLKSLGFRTVRHMTKLAQVSMSVDPMDECISKQVSKGHNKAEAEAICGCVKEQYASDLSDNIYVQAWADDIKSGVETLITTDDVAALPEYLDEKAEIKVVQAFKDEDIGDVLPPVAAKVEKTIKKEAKGVRICKTCKEELCPDCLKGCSCADCECNTKPDDDVKEASAKKPEVKASASVETVEQDKVNSDSDRVEALAMNGKRIRKSTEEVVKMAGKPQQVKDIEGNVEAGVPRGKATIKNEGADNIDVPMASPSVPRGKATLGNESADNIDVAVSAPDVAVGNSYMGHEKEVQKGMPAINNQIKGTVIAEVIDQISKDAGIDEASRKTLVAALNKQAKKFKEVDSIEGDVKAGVPRGKATIGNEGADNIDVSMDSPKVPRGKATLGNEGADNIDVSADAPDVPSQDAYMGAEKEVQKGMPENNRSMLKNVQQGGDREAQMHKIAEAREKQAQKVTAWLAANGRIASDLETFENTVQALSGFAIDKIASVAEGMFPAREIRVASSAKSTGHQVPAIVIESKGNEGKGLGERLASAFTIGNSHFDHNLTIYGEKEQK